MRCFFLMKHSYIAVKDLKKIVSVSKLNNHVRKRKKVHIIHEQLRRNWLIRVLFQMLLLNIIASFFNLY